MWVLQEKSFARGNEKAVENDPTLRRPFDAPVKYVQHCTVPKLHRHVEAYKELTTALL